MNSSPLFFTLAESKETKLMQRREHDKLRKRLWREKKMKPVIIIQISICQLFSAQN